MSNLLSQHPCPPNAQAPHCTFPLARSTPALSPFPHPFCIAFYVFCFSITLIRVHGHSFSFPDCLVRFANAITPSRSGVVVLALTGQPWTYITSSIICISLLPLEYLPNNDPLNQRCVREVYVLAFLFRKVANLD